MADSSVSSIVSVLGGGSGIDMGALANNLATAQFQLRSDRLAAQSDKLTKQISAASSLQNTLTQLASALGDRVRTGDLAVLPQIANGSVATVSSPPGLTGSGSYSLEVTSLAKSQTLASAGFASATTAVGSGSLTIRFGATDATSFTEDTAHAPLTVTIAAGATLTDVANAINAKNAGVNAYVSQTAQGAQLVLKGSEGTKNGFIVEATEATGDPGLAALAWDPTAGGDPADLLATSGDAQFKLDGLAKTSASNNVGTVAPGLSLKLDGTNAGAPTTIGFSSPVSNITTFMQDLVSALNSVVSDLNTATDPATGDLATDPAARALKQTLAGLGSQVVMPNAPDGSPRTLSDLGLAIQRDGTFRLDATRLNATLARDPTGAAAMFTTGLYGVFATVDKLSRNATSSANPGSLAGSIARYQKLSKQVTDDKSKLVDQQEALRTSLVARFAKADTQIGASKSTLSFLKAQIDAWNSPNN